MLMTSVQIMYNKALSCKKKKKKKTTHPDTKAKFGPLCIFTFDGESTLRS